MSHAQTAVVSAPIDWIERVTQLRLPAGSDCRLQWLMDRNNDAKLGPQERAELEALLELSEELALVRAEAFHLLGRKPT